MTVISLPIRTPHDAPILVNPFWKKRVNNWQKCKINYNMTHQTHITANSCAYITEFISCPSSKWMALNWPIYFNHVGLSSPWTYSPIGHDILQWQTIFIAIRSKGKVWIIDLLWWAFSFYNPAINECRFHASVEMCHYSHLFNWNVNYIALPVELVRRPVDR